MAVVKGEWRLPQQRTHSTTAHDAIHRPLRVVHGPDCSGHSESLAPSIRRQLLKSLYVGTDPFDAVNKSQFDHAYPHSNLRASFVHSVLQTMPSTRLWLEVGGFVGNSAVMTAAVAAHLCMRNLTIVTVDPFTGSLAFWELQRFIRKRSDGSLKHRWGYDFLQLSADGRPTIRERYLANVAWAGASPYVLPVTATGTVGMKLIGGLSQARREGSKPP